MTGLFHLHLVVLEEAGVRAERSLGLSLGEYNHLVHIGALSFEDALRLVDARGGVYDAGPTGAMAAVFPSRSTSSCPWSSGRADREWWRSPSTTRPPST